MSSGDYEGETNGGRYEGFGTYKLMVGSHQCSYVGNFENGLFHGPGTLYVKGGKFEGRWESGRLVDGNFVFEDGLPHKGTGLKNWTYCSVYDPRFQREIAENIENGDPLKYYSQNPNASKVPSGCFDTMDGYFDPKKLAICSYDKGEVLRMPDKEEKEWIIRHCRVSN